MAVYTPVYPTTPNCSHCCDLSTSYNSFLIILFLRCRRYFGSLVLLWLRIRQNICLPKRKLQRASKNINCLYSAKSISTENVSALKRCYHWPGAGSRVMNRQIYSAGKRRDDRTGNCYVDNVFRDLGAYRQIAHRSLCFY